MRTNPLNAINKILVIAVMIFGMTSCSKDKDNSKPDVETHDEVTYKGTSYPINAGGYDDLGYDEGFSNTELYLFNIKSDSDPLIPVYIYLDLFSPEKEFKGGTFKYVTGEENVEGKYFLNDAIFIRNMNIDTNKADEVVEIKDGTVKVSRDGENFKVEFDLVSKGNETIKGSYGGVFRKVSDNAAKAKNQLYNQIKKR